MAARTSQLVPDGAHVLGLGDMAYPLGDAAALASCYEPTWGRHRAATLAIPGNHDYVRGTASDFLDYFGVEASHGRWLHRVHPRVDGRLAADRARQ